MKTYKIILLVFDNPVADTPESIYAFRGLVTRTFKDVIYTQHIPPTKDNPKSTNDPSYPLIQYRSYKGKGALFGLGVGAERLLTDKAALEKNIGNCLKGSSEEMILSTEVSPKTYQLKGWLPFNNKGYSEFMEQDTQEQFRRLNRALSGGIRAFWDKILSDDERRSMKEQKQQLHVVINSFSEPYYKNVYVDEGKMRWRAYDIKFSANLDLPEWIGFGKVASKGNGVLSL